MTIALADHPVFDPRILRGFHLLEADAGTGKTWTISGLVVRALIERRLDIDAVLVVTFTRAATAELSQRIRARIEQTARALERRIAGDEHTHDDPFCARYAQAVADPHDALRRLRVALARIDEAQVKTIHAFCHRVITEHEMSIGLARGVRAEALGSEWLERGLAAWWRVAVASSSPHALALLHACGVSPGSLLGPVRAIDARPGARVVPAPFDWRALASEVLRCRERLAGALAGESDAFERWVGVKGNVNGTKMRPDHVRNRLAKLRAFVSAGLEGLAAIPPEVERFTTAHIAQDGKYEVPPFELVAACDALDALRADVAAVAGAVAQEAANEIALGRIALKAELGAIDHDDLLRIVRDALARPGSGPALAARLRARYPLALVDECQDTDALQWEIVRAIYQPRPQGRPEAALPANAPQPGDHALVLVGDPKQSIYAFRAADVYSYLEARLADPARHALHENQRSVPQLLEALNALFERDPPFLVPEIGFSPARAGIKPRERFHDRLSNERGAITVFALGAEEAGARPRGESDVDARGAMIAKPDGARIAVAATVAEIARLLAEGEAELGARALAPGDIAVLVNSHREGAQVKDALQRAGIGAAEISRDSVLESRECAELTRVIAAIATPSDAALVRGALATTMIDRFDVALDDANAPELLALLARARASWAAAGPQAALRGLLAALDVHARLATVSDAERRLTNLAHLIELLGRSHEGRQGAAPALRWLMRVRADPQVLGSDAVELRLESDENLVRIVTVHKSKGLEYPIVFAPFAWSGREFRRQVANPRAGARPAATAVNYHEPGAQPGAGWRAVVDFAADKGSVEWRLAATEAYSEALRTLYVAATRAQQRCYLCWGPVASAQFAPLSWLLAGLDPREQVAWASNSVDPPVLTAPLADEALRDWSQRANERAPGAVRVIPASATGVAGEPARASEASPEASLRAREFGARVPAPWLQTSFTALARQLADHPPQDGSVTRPLPDAPDHDQAVSADPEPVEAAEARFAFPAGALAGTCLHEILERTEFSEPVATSLVSAALERVGYTKVEPRGVARWLDEVIATPLACHDGPAQALADVERASIVRELEFHLAVGEADTRAVLDAIRAEYPLDAQVASHRWSGFLRGFIDLVYAARGRWYLLDWKSNRLGARWEDYDQAAMLRANAANAYPLQFCLYSLALHRLLRARLPGYDYEAHFGGVHYVYLRAARAAAGGAGAPATGVYTTRPSARLIRTLDQTVGGGQ